MIILSTVVSAPHHYIYLNKSFSKDLNWWQKFIKQWNGISIFDTLKYTVHHDVEIFVDASKTIGFGGFWDGKWFQQRWSEITFPDPSLKDDINWLELYVVVVAAVLWGKCWEKLRVLFRSDNKAVVDILHSNTSRNEHYMDLVRLLHFVSATNSFTITATHIAGSSNNIADSLSRFQVMRFRTLAPAAETFPHQVTQILSLLSMFE
eukprot:Lithocolla_globosa_v1_NODE_1862_length_2289_cov_60.952551.p2 type:complete len:206 gc:universal NODE_1862_length_2289_cov_60.952551:185-802(+)